MINSSYIRSLKYKESLVLPQEMPIFIRIKLQIIKLSKTYIICNLAFGPNPTPPKVDYATDLFNMLSMDDANANGSKAVGATADDNNWGGFQSAAELSIAEKTGPPNAFESTSQSASGIEDLFKDSFSVTPSLAPAKPQKDVKNDIINLFEKSNIVSPFAMHQQQLVMLTHQHSLLMAVASKSTGIDLKYPIGIQQPSSNVFVQNRPPPGFPAIKLDTPKPLFILFRLWLEDLISHLSADVLCKVVLALEVLEK